MEGLLVAADFETGVSDVNWPSLELVGEWWAFSYLGEIFTEFGATPDDGDDHLPI
jgi:hypothetical protein